MSKVFVGIDSGLHGAIAFMDENGKVESVQVMPRIAKEFDTNAFNQILKSFGLANIECVFIEKVHAVFGSAAGATFTFGKVCGIIEGIVVSNNLKYVYVEPKAWQKAMFQGIPEIRKAAKVNKNGRAVRGKIDTKIMSELACKRLFPEVNFTATERCTKTHDGMTDAVLIAEYGRRLLK